MYGYYSSIVACANVLSAEITTYKDYVMSVNSLSILALGFVLPVYLAEFL